MLLVLVLTLCPFLFFMVSMVVNGGLIPAFILNLNLGRKNLALLSV